MTTDVLQATCTRTREILANVRPEQYGEPTPCKLWDVQRLINHAIGASHWVAHCVTDDLVPEHALYEEVDYTGRDVLDEYDTAVKTALAAFDVPGSLTKRVSFPFGTLTGEALLDILIDDQFLHGWDLAKATSQPLTDADQAMAERRLAAHENHPIDQYRGPEGIAPYGARVEVPASALATDRLAGFFGRNP
jgi:uncharacterized protein (TIGR03086 family)